MGSSTACTRQATGTGIIGDRSSLESLVLERLQWVTGRLGRVGGFVPVTVLGIALLATLLARAGAFVDLGRPVHPLDPAGYVTGMLFHEDWSHLTDNLLFWLPVGAVFTWPTSNRHVLGLVVTVQVLATAIGMAIGRPALGLSVVLFGVAAASLVRATGVAARGASTEGRQLAVAGALLPVLGGFLFVAVLARGGSWIGHFGHFFGALFGGAVEAMYVLDDGGDGDGESPVSASIGR